MKYLFLILSLCLSVVAQTNRQISQFTATNSVGTNAFLLIDTQGSNATHYVTRKVTPATLQLSFTNFLQGQTAIHIGGSNLVYDPLRTLPAWNESATNNTFIGVGAGASNTVGYYLTYAGMYSGHQGTNSVASTVFGSRAGENATTISTSVLEGYRAGYGIEAGTTISNSFIGGYRGAHDHEQINYSTVVGYEGTYSTKLNFENSLVGALIAKDATNAQNLSGIGVNAFRFAINASNSVAAGRHAGYYMTNTYGSVFLGDYAGGMSGQDGSLTNLTLLGAGTSAGQSDLTVLGRQNQDIAIGTNRASYKIDVLDTNIDNAPVIRLSRGVQGVNNTMNVLGWTNANYLHIGGKENRNNSYQGIGFGYNDGTALAPAAIGLHTTSNSGYTKGDVVIAVRDVTTDTAPTDALRVRSSGSVMLPRMNSNKLLYLDSNTNIAEVTIGSGLTLTTGTLAASGGGGTPGGSSGQLQFNDSGSFGGAAGITVTQGTNMFVGKLTVTNSLNLIGDGVSATAHTFYATNQSNYHQLLAAQNIATNAVTQLFTNGLTGIVIASNLAGGTNQLHTVALTNGQYLSHNGTTYTAVTAPAGGYLLYGGVVTPSNPLDGQTYYVGYHQTALDQNAGRFAIPIIKAGTITAWGMSFRSSTGGDTTSIGMDLFLNGTTSVGATTVTFDGTTNKRYKVTGLSQAVAVDDTIQMRMNTGAVAWPTTNPVSTTISFWVLIE